MQGPRTAREIAKECAARRMDYTAAWSRFVIERALKPEMDAREFNALVDQHWPGMNPRPKK